MQIQNQVNTLGDQVTRFVSMLEKHKEDVEHRISLSRDVDPTWNFKILEEAGLKSDHTASAHNLLDCWPVPKEWFEKIPYLQKLKKEKRKVSEYAIELEKGRWSIFPLDLGEDFNLDDYGEGLIRPGNNNELSASQPTMKRDGSWSLPRTYKALPDRIFENMPQERFDNPSGLGQDGRLDVRRVIVDDLLALYHHNIHTLHPFLNLSELQKMFQGFKEQCNADAGHGDITSPADYQLKPGMKRKRCSSARGVPYLYDYKMEYSLRNAIVLLVLALGKVCSQLSDNFNNDAGTGSKPRNIAATLGMAYYTRAAAILGAHHGGQTIEHAQAFILAALYMGQSARVLESWSWANQACRIATILVKQ
jgi:hypothetical protein